jgi:hypothetical protein
LEQDDSDLVFDDGIFADDEASWSSVVNSRVKREPPPSLEEGDRRGGRHRQLVSGVNGSKSSSLGHWDRHQQKTKKQLHQSKQQQQHHGDNKDVKTAKEVQQHRRERHGKVDVEKKSQVVVAKANLRQLEPIKKKHNNDHKTNHNNKKNQQKVPIAMKIDDDDEDMMLGDGSGSGDGEIIPLPPSQGEGGSASGTRSKISFYYFIFKNI